MSSIGAISGNTSHIPPSSVTQAPPKRVDPDHDGDNDAGKSKAAEAAEASHQAQHTVNIKA
jgi:hypothetical protein